MMPFRTSVIKSEANSMAKIELKHSDGVPKASDF